MKIYIKQIKNNLINLPEIRPSTHHAFHTFSILVKNRKKFLNLILKKASLLSYVTYCGPTNILPLEAMYTGCPMICSNVYGMPKQVNKSALMINPKSYRDIYKKMILLFSNNKIKKRLVQKGYETLNKNKNQNIKKIIEKLNF